MVGTSWLLVPVNSLGKLDCSRGWYLPWSAVVHDNLEGVHATSQLICAIWQEMLGAFLSLRLA